MPNPFDKVIDRRAIANLNKWTFHPPDVLPFWLADMDFATPSPILKALRRALDHGILGYERGGPALFETIAARLERLYGWRVAPESIVPVPGVNVGLRVAAAVTCPPGAGVLVQPPVFFHAHAFLNNGLARQEAPLRRADLGCRVRYEYEPLVFRQALHSGGARTRLFMLCNPHNPVGRLYAAAELADMAQVCAAREITMISDEVHSELLLGGAAFTPLAALSPEIADRTITFLGPGKTFNVSGLACAFAVIPNPHLRERFSAELHHQSLEVNSLGLAAAQAAYSGECEEWLAGLRAYLTANRDFLAGYLQSELPLLRATLPEATYLAWIDCSGYTQSGKIPGAPVDFFLEQARVALTDGALFGPGGAGCVRLNFACPRSVLEAGLERIKLALIG